MAMEVGRAGTSKVEEGATSKEEEAGTAEDTKPGRSHLLDLGLGVEVLLLAVQTVFFLFLLCPVFHRSFSSLALSALFLRYDSFSFPAVKTFFVRDVCEMHQVFRSVKSILGERE